MVDQIETNVAHLQYIFFHYVKFQNPRTNTLYQSAVDNLLYKYSEISQILQQLYSINDIVYQYNIPLGTGRL